MAVNASETPLQLPSAAAPLTGYLAVAGALAAFIFLYSVDVFCVIVPWLSYSVPGVTNLAVLTCTTAAALYCFMFCVCLDPGRVPAGWNPDNDVGDARGAVLEVKKKGGAARFCQKCQQYKPPRSHHCRVCQRCVLRMDHHCPGVNNCIGHSNYKAFLLMLLYTNAALVHTLGLIAAHTMHTMQIGQEQRILRTGPHGKPVLLAGEEGIRHIWLWALMQTLAFAVSLPLMVGLMMLLGWHLHLLLVNKTTIEYQEGVTARIQATTSSAPGFGGELQHPYDVGSYHNLHEILGDNVGTWMLPPCAPTEGGTEYPTFWDLPQEQPGSDRGRL